MGNRAEDLVKDINATVKEMGGFKEFESSSLYDVAEEQLIDSRPECKSCKSCNTKFRFFNNKYISKNVQPRYECRDCRHMFTIGGKRYKRKQHLERPQRGKRYRGKQHLEKPELESASVSICKMQDHVEHQQQFTVSSQSLGCQQQHQQQQSLLKDLIFHSTLQQQQLLSPIQDLIFHSTLHQQQHLSARSDQGAEFQHVQAHTHHSDQAAGVQNQRQHYPQAQLQVQQPSCDQEIQNPQLLARSDAVAEVLFQQHHTHKQRSIHESDSVQSQTEINLIPQLSVRSDSVAGVQLQQHHGQEPPQSVQTHNHESDQDATLRLRLQTRELLPGSYQHARVEQHHIQEQPQPGQLPIHESHQHVAVQLQPFPVQDEINLLQQELLSRSDPVAEVQLQRQQPLPLLQPGNHESDKQLEIIQEGYSGDWLEKVLLDEFDEVDLDEVDQHAAMLPETQRIHAELQTSSKQLQTEINILPHELPLRSYSKAGAAEVQLQQLYGQDPPQSVQAHNHESDQDTTLQLRLQTQKQVSQKSDPAATAAGGQVQKHYVQQPPKTVRPHNDEFDQDASLELGLQIPEHQQELPGSCQHAGVQLKQHHMQEQLQPGQPPTHESHQHVALQRQPLSLQSQAGSKLVPQQLLSISDSVQLEQQPANHESDQDAALQLQSQEDVSQLLLQLQNQLQQIIQLVSQQNLFQKLLLQPTVFQSAAYKPNQEMQVPKSANDLPLCSECLDKRRRRAESRREKRRKGIYCIECFATRRRSAWRRMEKRTNV